MENRYTIGQLASEVDVPVSTLRYYERRGLITPSTRTHSNYRLYDEASLERLEFIRSAQSAGFTLRDITTLLGLRLEIRSPCGDVQNLIAARIDDVQQQRSKLEEVEVMLHEWLTRCREAQQSGQCAVLEGLRSAGKKKNVGNRNSP